MAITDAVRKHGLGDSDILHAIRNPFRYIEQEYDGELRILVLGADCTGRLLEIVVVPAHDPQRVIHADRMRPRFYDYLSKG
ncbi:DUF4258 domain-containing protein [Phytoactinopolyspora halotolerans]|uniref:BrnT family toxin n=1 Tax=Phytoactinopolyspora halotolerans TaxID=1981512 RepID=A0A6L9SBE9_9ACTN|nr:DUF4258 domain-containing protein [Phytoactinopolyspora halotolerans]NEE01912.1 hypothetical protein [Phytoactinopolyspora halotolerans]